MLGRSIIQLLLLWWCLGGQSSEGYPLAMERMGMDLDTSFLCHFTGTMKAHGTPPPMGSGPNKRDLQKSKSSVAKRSFRRALKRIATHGYCWYRGQCLNRADVSQVSLNQVLHQTPPPKVGRMGPRLHGPLTSKSTHAPRNRIAAVVWNPGGLSRSKLQEFLIWADQQSTGLFVLPETRWTFESMWGTDRWLFVHSGPDSGGNMLES